MGPAAISPASILAWQQLHRVRLTSWEVETIEMLDSIALPYLSESQKTS